MPTDPTQDQDFLSASPQDQHAYLMHSDPDYAKAAPDDQKAYLAHVRTIAPKPSSEAITKAYPDVTPTMKQALASGNAPFIAPTQFEKENTIPKWYGFTPRNVVKNAWEGAKGLVGSAAQGAYDIGLGEVNPETNEIEHGAGGLIGLNTKGEFAPIERARAIAHRYITGPAGEHIGKAEEALQRGDTLEAIGHGTAAALPLVGPWAASLGEQAGTGDIGGATGQGLGTIAAGELMAHPTMIGKSLKALGGGTADVLHNPLNIGLSAEERITKAIRPRARATGWEEAIESPGVQRAIAEYHAESPIKSMDEFKDAIPQIKDSLWNEKVQPALDRQGPRAVDMKPVGEQVRAAITPEMREFHPEKVQGLEDLATKLERARTVEEADRLQKYANAQLESYYNKYPTGRRSAFATNPETMEWELARRGVRDQLLKTLEDAGETEVRDARKDYGNLTTIQKELERKVNVNARKSTMSLPRILGMISAVPTHGIGIVAGELAHHFAQPDILLRQGIKRLNPPEAAPFTPPAPYVLPETIQGQAAGQTPTAAPVTPISAPIRAPEPLSAPQRPIPEGEGLLPRLQESGQHGILGQIEARRTGAADLKVGDTFVDDKGEPRRIVDIAEGKIETADGTKRTYEDEVGHLGEINSPRAQLARGGKFIAQETQPSEADRYLQSLGREVPEVELGEETGPRANASGQPGGGGLEEQGRIQAENAVGVKYFREDAGGKRTPLIGLGRQDLRANPGGKIIRVEANGQETVLDARPIARRLTRP